MAKYIGPDGYEYSLEELNNLSQKSTSSFSQFAGRNLPQGQTAEDQAQHIASVYQAAQGQNPDDTGRAEEAANILGIEPQVMNRASRDIVDAAELSAKSKINSPADWGKFVNDYPQTANYLSDGKNMSMSYDDIMSLSETERTIKNTVRMGELHKQRSQIGLQLQGQGRDLSTLDHEERRRIDMLDNELRTLQGQLPQTTWSAQGLLSGLVGMADPIVAGAKAAGVGAVAGATAGATTAGILTVPGAAAGAGLGFTMGMADEFAANAMGNAYVDNIVAQSKNPKAGALLTGIGTYALGFVQAGKWLKIPEEVGLKHLSLTAVEQGLMGAGFTAADISGQKVATDNYNITAQDAKNMAKGGLEMIPIGLAMSAPSYGVAGLRRLGEVADNSKTATRSPSAFADKINSEVQGTILEQTAISSEGLSAYLYSVKPEEADALMAKMKITPDALAEAIATGGDVKIDAGTFATLEKSVREALLPDARVGNTFTEKEIQSKKAELDEALKQEQQPTAGQGNEKPVSIADDLGLKDVKEYSDAEVKTSSDKERLLSEREQAKNVIEQNKEYQDRMEEARKQVEEEVNNDPVHLASDALKFDLQMFNNAKDIKEVAKKYLKGKLSEAERMHFEDVAEAHKLTGDTLAEQIKHGKLKDTEIESRLKQISEKIKEEMVGSKTEVTARAEINDSNMKKVAMEAEALSGMAKGEHKKDNAQKKEAEINKRWQDAEQKLLLDIEKAKGEEKVNQLKDQLTELKKQHADELKQHQKELEQNARWRDAEGKQKDKAQKGQDKNDSKLAKEWLKSETVSQWIARNSEISMTAAKQMAKDIIASKTLTELRHMGAADWKNYFNLSKQAKVNSERSYRKGKYEEAAKYKKQELLNHALAMEAMKAEKEIGKIDKGLKKFIKRGKDLMGMPVEFMGQIDGILRDYGLSTREPVAMPGEKPLSLKEFIAKMTEEYHPVAIPEFISQFSPKSHILLTLSQYKDVYTAVRTISALGKKYDKFLSLFNKLTINEAAKLAKETIEKEVGSKYSADYGPGSQYKNKVYEKVVSMIRLLDHVIPSQVNALTLSKFFDGGDKGPMHDHLYNLLAHAEAEKINRRTQAGKDITKIFDEFYGKSKEAISQRKKRIYFEHLDRYFTKEEIVMFGMNWGNEGNRDRIMRGYGWLNKDGTYDMAKVKPILDKLGKKEWDFCQNVWNYLETYWPDIKTLEMEVAGVEPERVKPSEIVTSDGNYNGGYFPISYDYGKSADAYKNIEQKNALYQTNSAAHAHTAHGHTEARAQKHNLPIKLSMDVLFTHLDNVIHDLAYRKAIIDANRFLNHKDTQTAIVNAVGMDGHKMLNDWLKSIAGDQGRWERTGEKLANWFRYASTYAGMGLRIALFPIDTLGNLSNGIWEVGTPTMVRAIKDYAVSPKETHDLVVNNSAFMQHRTMIRERDLWDLSNKWYEGNSGLKNFAFATMAWSDQIVSFPLWAETYKIELGNGRTAQEAIDVADNRVKQTIGSGSILDQVGAQRGSAYKKLLSMYFSWASMMFNRMWLSSKQSGVQWGQGDKLAAVGTISKAMFFGFIVQGLVDGVIREAERNEENPDEDKRAKRMAARFASQPLSYWWLARDAGQFAINKSMGQYTDYKLSPVESSIETMVNGSLAIPALLKDDENTLKDAEKIAKGVASTGLYPQQMNAWAFNFLDWIGDNGEAHWQDFVTRRSKKQ